jgi:signal transduction histidine kinase
MSCPYHLKNQNRILTLIDNAAYRFLDKTAIMTPQDHVNADGSLVEEAICLLRVVPLWAAAIIYYFAIVQQHTYVVFRAVQSHRRIGNSNFKIPAATYIYIVLLMLSSSIFISIYDRIFVPFLRRITGKEGGITILQRIGTGIFLTIAAMLVSGLISRREARDYSSYQADSRKCTKKRCHLINVGFMVNPSAISSRNS